MSENLSGGSSSENLVSTPPRQSRPAPAPTAPKPRRAPAAEPPSRAPAETKQTGPITSDDMKLKKKVTVNKPLTFRTDKNKKKD